MRLLLRCLALSFLATALPAHAAAPPGVDEKSDRQARKWVDEKIKALQAEKDPQKREDAAEYLGGSEYPAAISALTAALADPAPRVRVAAARSLWRSHKAAEPARAALTKALDDVSGDVAVRAAGALQALGVPAKDLAATRRRVLDGPASATDTRFLAASGLIGIDEPTRLLGPVLAYTAEWSTAVPVSDPNYDAQRTNSELATNALQELAATRDRGLVAPLTKAARSGQPGTPLIIKALGSFEPKPTGWTATLVELLGSANVDVQEAALKELAGQHTEKDVAAWASPAARFVKSPDDDVRSAALDALGAAGGLAAEQVGAVVDALGGDPDKYVRRSAARALVKMGDRTAAVPVAAKQAVAQRAHAPLLKAIAGDAEVDTRLEALDALNGLALGEEGSAGDLATIAGSGNALEVRLRALSHLRNREAEARSALPAIEALARDPEPRVRAAAQEAAERVKSGRRATPGGAPVAATAAAASQAAPAGERAALALLRERGVAFDDWNFYRAIGQGDAELVKAFVDAGIPVNRGFEGTGDDPPLKMALVNQACAPTERPTKAATLAIVQALVEKGASAAHKDKNGNTPLMDAAIAGCDRTVMRLLIRSGGDVKAANAMGLTAFEMGLWSGHDGLEELIAAGYRLPAAKAATYKTAYATQPASLALIAKASGSR